MIGIDTKQLGNGGASRSAATAQKVANLFLAQAVSFREANQRPAFYPDFRFHPFRVEGH